jgi:hypothetical protein
VIRPTAYAFTVTGRKWANMNGSHGHHRAHQALMNEWKHLAYMEILARESVPHIDAPVVITATVQRTTERCSEQSKAHSDAHNVTPSIKACIDAAVSAGVIYDDCDCIVKRLIIEPGPKAKQPTVTIRIEAA